MNNLTDDMTRKMMSEITEKRESLIKEMLKKKGYEHLIPTEKTRFPKINRCISFDGWEYIFVDNESKQGEFIVALSPLKFDNDFDYSCLSDGKAFCETKITFTWQDSNFDAVRLP